MATLSRKTKGQKFINFGLPIDLYVEFEQAIDYLNSSKAELLRDSIRKIVKKAKRERIQQNLREAYIANNDLLEKEAEVWDYVSVEGL
ncbi:MAG: hypothetical protein IIB40_10285 [Candidatus Marinimicrobia bacterium]|nr:hypothetical protein [Candidatus Neomarinimicrobiota bacterium]